MLVCLGHLWLVLDTYVMSFVHVLSRLGPRSGSKYCDTYAVAVVPPHKDRCIPYVYTYVLSSDVVSLWPFRFSRVLQPATAGFGWHAFQRAVFIQQLVFG